MGYACRITWVTYMLFINTCYIPEFFDFLLFYHLFCEKHGGNMVTMPGSGFSQLGSGPDCSHRVKTVLWFWARLLTLAVSLFAYVRVHVQLGIGKVYAGDNPAMD